MAQAGPAATRDFRSSTRETLGILSRLLTLFGAWGHRVVRAGQLQHLHGRHGGRAQDDGERPKPGLPGDAEVQGARDRGGAGGGGTR